MTQIIDTNTNRGRSRTGSGSHSTWDVFILFFISRHYKYHYYPECAKKKEVFLMNWMGVIWLIARVIFKKEYVLCTHTHAHTRTHAHMKGPDKVLLTGL